MPIFGKQPIITILMIQALASGLVAGGLALWLGSTAGISALLGGVVAVVPNAFLAARLLTPGIEASGGAMLKAAWLGEIGKLLITAALFAAVFVAVRPLSVAAVFAGYIAAQLVILCAPLMSGAWLDGNHGKTEV